MYPISYDVDYEVERNRLTTFFRLIIGIPWMIWLQLYGIAATVVAVIAWFALMFTKRYPQGMYGFVAGYLRLQARVAGYLFLLTDELPPFSGKADADYPVRVDIASPQPEYRRSRTFFKYLVAFPQQVVAGGLGTALMGASFVTWWRILFTGKQSIMMHDALLGSAAYVTRSAGFLLLLTEAHPRMLEVTPHTAPRGSPGLLYSGEDPELLPPGTMTPAAAAPPPPESPPAA